MMRPGTPCSSVWHFNSSKKTRWPPYKRWVNGLLHRTVWFQLWYEAPKVWDHVEHLCHPNIARQNGVSVEAAHIANSHHPLHWDLNLEFQMLVALRVITAFEWSRSNRLFFDFFPFFLPMNMPSSNMQHWKSQKKNFTLVFLFIFCYFYWLYPLIDFLRQIDQFFWPIDRSINFSIFFNRSIEFLKWSIIN